MSWQWVVLIGEVLAFIVAFLAVVSHAGRHS